MEVNDFEVRLIQGSSQCWLPDRINAKKKTVSFYRYGYLTDFVTYWLLVSVVHQMFFF